MMSNKQHQQQQEKNNKNKKRIAFVFRFNAFNTKIFDC